ncbi:MAG: hypothetical protein K2H64_00125 [Desulfovibrio sp.]|nr:hypothetical protein [Desulfovibrio sp.]
MEDAEAQITRAFLPAFALTVGVTGHRRPPPERLERIEAELGRIFAEIRSAAGEISAGGAEFGVFGDEPVLRLASCLSEGADRLAAKKALEAGYRLQAFLPFPVESPVNAMDLADPDRETSRAELKAFCARAESAVEFSPRPSANLEVLGIDFDPLGEDDFARVFRQDAYLEASLAMLGQSDILVAIWNGKSQTAPGGTYDTVLRALNAGVPVCVIDAGADRPVRVLSCREDLFAPDCKPATVREVILKKWGLSGTKTGRELLAVKNDLIRNTRKDLPPLANAWNWFQNLVVREKLRNVDGGPYREETRADFQIFDRMANNYAARYRSSFLGLALMSLLAVLFGAVTVFAPSGAWRHPLLLLFAVCETAFLAFSLLNMRRARKAGWLEKLTTYRYIAEVLRCDTITASLGLVCPRGESGESLYTQDARTSWSEYYLRNAIRAFGLASINYGDEADLESRFADIGSYLIYSQACYHKRNNLKSGLVANSLEMIGQGLFYLSLLVIGGRFATTLIFDMSMFDPAISFVSTLAPAAAASAQGIVQTAELRRLAIRSHNIYVSFALAYEKFQGTKDADVRREIAMSVIALMIRDVSDWKDQYNLSAM